MSSLRTRNCKPCEGGVNPLQAERAQRLLQQVPGWSISHDGISIRRKYSFKGFAKTLSFINAMAWIATQQGHHPDFKAGYDFCDVSFTTHAIKGLSENDFICAYRVNALLES